MNDIYEQSEFRTIRPEETDQVVSIEQICFPPNEACSPAHMRERIPEAADFFLAALDRKNGKMAGFLNGIAVNEDTFRDEFFTDSSLHNPDGRNVMITGLDVLPEYRGKGLARALVNTYQYSAQKAGIHRLVLTCLPDKYQKFGFTDKELSASKWGEEEWHEMICILKS